MYRLEIPSKKEFFLGTQRPTREAQKSNVCENKIYILAALKEVPSKDWNLTSSKSAFPVAQERSLKQETVRTATTPLHGTHLMKEEDPQVEKGKRKK